MDKIALVVDDDRTERRLIISVLRHKMDISFIEAEHGKDALRILDKNDNIVLIILDLDMPVMDGMHTLSIIKKNYPDIPVIILTGDKDAKHVINAMKMGAVDFLYKPIENARLDVSSRNALKMSLMSQEISRLKRRPENTIQFSDLIGYEGGLTTQIKTGRKAASCDLPVLVTGETGTGKEIFARAIHGESKRADRPFIAVNCGAIPEKLVESILFGHEKGAFTGAINKSAGKFQEANNGTIFLDEIGELPLDAQVKLLRVLQQGEVEPVGAGKPVPVNVRIISATNRDLIEETKAARFREDIYFRLNVLHIHLPPLRMRKNDIPFLTTYFIEKFCMAHQISKKNINQKAIDKLQEYSWSGNVRELENTINRAIALCENDTLEPEDFYFLHADISSDVSAGQNGLVTILHPDGRFRTLQEIEQEIVTQALAHHAGNISQTARVLGIAKSTLYAKLENLADKKHAV